ncbi:hypothetical protein SBA3_1830013 [Candidatus Sulfopaludibacter sp. SbA3]|nr:hypothetical protein SBA3_1830013 [Candidatus Sulfopaludibacter sp. SbA3]
MTIESHDLRGAPLPRGLNWTEFHQRKSDGRTLYIRHTLSMNAPPYGWMTSLLFGVVALYARRTAAINPSA